MWMRQCAIVAILIYALAQQLRRTRAPSLARFYAPPVVAVGVVRRPDCRAGRAAERKERLRSEEDEPLAAISRTQRGNAQSAARRGVCSGPGGGPPQTGHAALRRAAPGRHGCALQLDRRDADRRGQNPDRHPAAVLGRTRRQGRSLGDGQRLPGPARRRLDAPLYETLGLKVGCIQSQMPQPERRKQYQCDVTYGTANEMGFDFLRDRLLKRRISEGQRDLFGAMLGQAGTGTKSPCKATCTSCSSTKPIASSSTRPARR